MNILLVGFPVFARELAALGHAVYSAGTAPGSDVVLPPGKFSLDAILATLGPSRRPDLCLLVENIGAREFPLGLERSPIPVVFYSIDSHLNFFWQQHFARVCDCVLTTQRDFVAPFSAVCPDVQWLPWSCDPAEYDDTGSERDLDVVFVGSADDSRPKRKLLLELAARQCDLRVFSPLPGKWYTAREIAAIFNRAKIVINESVCREVNFRVFEAIGAGAMLLTERVDNGLGELFEEGRHLVAFTPFDLVRKLGRYLADGEERSRIARAGREHLLRHHLRSVRAARLAAILERVERRPERNGVSLARSYVLLLRRGVVPVERYLPLAAAMLDEACRRGDRDAAAAWLDRGELYQSLGERQEAASSYAASWLNGERSVRLALQWGVALLELGREEEARAILRLLADMGIPAPLGEELAAVLGEAIPSAGLYLVLGRIAESTEDRFRPGFVSVAYSGVPLSGVDYAEMAQSLAPHDVAVAEMLARIRFENGDYLLAARSYLDAWEKGEGGIELLERAAQALALTYKLDETAEVMRLVCGQTNARKHHDFLCAIEDAIAGGKVDSGG